jgi:hypothetical protein
MGWGLVSFPYINYPVRRVRYDTTYGFTGSMLSVAVYNTASFSVNQVATTLQDKITAF